MLNKQPKILVFIPTYRCAPQISRVLSQFNTEIQLHIDTVIIIDNKSPDNTINVAIDTGKEIFTNCKFIVWENNDNYGLGGSHKAAFNYGIKNNYDYLIVLHGDDQANINDILPYLTRIKQNPIDCLLGARFMKDSQLENYSWFRTFGNRVYNILFSLVTFKNIYDLGSGLNLYRLDTLKSNYFDKFPDDLTFNYIMLLASYSYKQKVKFFPITWREEDQVSNVKLFRQAFKVLELLARYALSRKKFIRSEMRVVQHKNYNGEIIYHKEQSTNIS